MNQKDYVEQFVNKNQKQYLKNIDIHLKIIFIARLYSTLNLIQIKIYHFE